VKKAVMKSITDEQYAITSDTQRRGAGAGRHVRSGSTRSRRRSNAISGALWVVWQAVRIPVFAVLLVLEPFARLILGGVAAVALFVTLFFGLIVKPPHFPFWGMLAFSVGFAVALTAYYWLLRAFAPR
jgi:hypothetical protein